MIRVKMVLGNRERKIMENTENEIIETGSVEIEESANAGPEQEEAKGKTYPTQTVLTIRAIVGGYVMYLAYQIATSENEVTPWMWAAVALFVIAGGFLVGMSVKHFICGEYEGGRGDHTHR